MSDERPNESSGNPLTPARPEEVAEALSYALRYDERGRPRPHRCARRDAGFGSAGGSFGSHVPG